MKKFPERTCIGCNCQKNKSELIRIAKTKTGKFFVDESGKMQGRGAYICKNATCLKKAMKKKKQNISLEIYENLRGVIIDKQ